MINGRLTIDTGTKFNKQSREQNRHESLCAEWFSIKFVPMQVVEHVRFRNLMANANFRIDTVSADSISRELTRVGLEVNEYHINIIQDIAHMENKSVVWEADYGEGFCYFTVSYVTRNGEFKTYTCPCSTGCPKST